MTKVRKFTTPIGMHLRSNYGTSPFFTPQSPYEWLGLGLAKQSACIALYYRNTQWTWNVVERTAYI